ncbi:carboxymuconolactone decarboxylase family protein [Pelomicrobium sp.]|jgi:AhpD family alkylhydroperoxidase|uniref:carboxymuconolactone decarboxylase family protein n=1 Tax=Pelomicrobium sp. TaxID=2815319 RepID=UPI002FDEF8D2
MAKDKAPKAYLQLKKAHGPVFDALERLGQQVREAGPLDEKTGHLIQLAAAAATRSEGAVHSHVRRALAAGASREEIHHSLLLLVSTIGFPHVVAALTWAEDVIGKK